MALVAVLMLALAVPSLAAERQTPQTRSLILNQYSSIWLGYGPQGSQYANVYGNESIDPGRKVTSWLGSTTAAQDWLLKTLSGPNGLEYVVASRLKDAYGREYVLNKNTSTKKCIVWPLESAATADTVIAFPGSNLAQTIRLKYSDAYQYFSPDGLDNGSPISWGTTPFVTE